jgi:hypothetical protein
MYASEDDDWDESDLEGTTHFFKKLHKFVDPVRPKQMSAVDHSVGPQKEQQM